jgi:hypothetical protein
MFKKLLFPVLFVVICLSIPFVGSTVVHYRASHTSVTTQVTQVDKVPAQVPDGPYNDVIGPNEKPAPKPEIEQPLP